jgi:hypothetical protein
MGAGLHKMREKTIVLVASFSREYVSMQINQE